MKQGALRILQEELATAGLYQGPIDGQLNDTLDQSAAGVIEARPAELSGDPSGWSTARKRVAAFQLACKDAGIEPGPADGLWGSLTETAYADFAFFKETGERPLNFRDIVPLDANPNGWPADHAGQQALFDFFDFNPNHGGEPQTTIVTVPWEMKLDWQRSVTTSRIGCHPKVAESLERVLVKIADRYDEAARIDMGLDLYGGCKFVRAKQNGSTWSTHSFAAAIDFDPGRNRLDWGWKKSRLARADCLDFWTFWEEEGWLSLGRVRNFDWMHVQAIKLP
ncbi:hypothetical protein [Aestuariivita sp.]|jgi:hypothetical protein|uniref:hypothetical protein n=1 Tax=Aestuariivita sp. TaxID=1872407 RepID=UPI002173C955|nr:hypothetical protein [Aestuariivita sp.]MCE8009131.1 M15 family peptidase [Aestuariivita sp.]